jgi:hypothetical protein
MAVANSRLPEHIVGRWAASTIMNALAREPFGKGLVQIDIDGDEVILTFRKGKKLEAMGYRAGPELKAFMAELRMARPCEHSGNIDLLPWEDEAA